MPLCRLVFVITFNYFEWRVRGNEAIVCEANLSLGQAVRIVCAATSWSIPSVELIGFAMVCLLWWGVIDLGGAAACSS